MYEDYFILKMKIAYQIRKMLVYMAWKTRKVNRAVAVELLAVSEVVWFGQELENRP